MGQKVHPLGMRLGISKEWGSVWFAERYTYRDTLVEDLRLRKAVDEYCRARTISGVSRIEIRRKATTQVELIIFTAKPGLLIGRRGKGIEELRQELEKVCSRQIYLNVQEVREPRLDAELTAQSVAQALERRMFFRRVMSRTIQDTMKAGARGIKIRVAGRLGGGEIARRETQREGKIPLSTLRADVDYAMAQARTAYGYIGVKVWICLDDGVERPVLQASRARAGSAGGETPC